jgi:hypothetical protein
VRAWLVAGALTSGVRTRSSRRHGIYRTTEDARALLRATQEIYAERHGAQTFTLGTHQPLQAAAERIGIGPNSIRYHEAIEELEYESAIEWDESARYARGSKHYVITERGLKMLREPG